VSSPASPSPTEIRTEGLVKVYGARTVVNGVNVHVGAGEVVGLLGPNGAGKTTTFYMIVGLVPATAGRVALGERDLTRLRMRQRARLGLGYLPQEASVFRKLSVEDNILAIAEAIGYSAPRAGRLRRAAPSGPQPRARRAAKGLHTLRAASAVVWRSPAPS
jgi:lipopolysaccharide export system ATP-binding protein